MVVLLGRGVRRLDPRQILHNALAARTISVGAGLGCVFVPVHYDDPLSLGPTLCRFALLLNRSLILRSGRVTVVRDYHLVAVIERHRPHVFFLILQPKDFDPTARTHPARQPAEGRSH